MCSRQELQANFERIIQELNQTGKHDAANFLENKANEALSKVYSDVISTGLSMLSSTSPPDIPTIEAKETRGSTRLGEKQMDDRIPNIAAMDNGTMVETFKFLNYYQLATSSLVSKRYWNLIRTHRHSLALLDVDITMNSYVSYPEPAVIRMCNKVLSTKYNGHTSEYNEWIVRNGYSTQIPFESQIAATENVREFYQFRADRNSDPAMEVFYTHVELEDETWPLFQHFIRLFMDPFIYIRFLDLNPQKGLSLLTGAMNPDRDRLQCKRLNVYFDGDVQKLLAWIKDHVRCDEFGIKGSSDSNYDEVTLDFFLTGAPCTTEIYVKRYDLLKVVDLVQVNNIFNKESQQIPMKGTLIFL
ncbi:hypothetical protein Ddc_24175 [Ditylenchus destructor]|nr:hypothetical protein Ddc_24175 [Ditylenchus destructor]